MPFWRWRSSHLRIFSVSCVYLFLASHDRYQDKRYFEYVTKSTAPHSRINRLMASAHNILKKFARHSNNDSALSNIIRAREKKSTNLCSNRKSRKSLLRITDISHSIQETLGISARARTEQKKNNSTLRTLNNRYNLPVGFFLTSFSSFFFSFVVVPRANIDRATRCAWWRRPL